MNLMVTCPSCGTVFTMVREQLDASDGRVRCGHCMEVFNAQTQLAKLDNVSHLEFAQTPIQPISHANLSFVQQAKKDAFWSNPLMRIGLVLVAISLFSLLSLQIARTERERLAHWSPALTPSLTKLCNAWPCISLARRLVDGWLIENSSFQKESNNAFRLITTLKNTSQTTLLVPQLELNLLDNSDALLVRHVIAPNSNDPAVIPSGAERMYNWIITPQANASIRLNAKDIVGYRLVLFYP